MTTNVSPAVLQPGAQLTTSSGSYVTGAANNVTIIKRATFNNVTSASVTFTVWRVTSGGSAGATNQLITARPIPASSTDLAPELSGIVLNGGDSIVCAAGSAAAINFFAAGYLTS